MAGAGAAAQTIAGLITGELSASQDYSGGTGYAVRLGYGYDRLDWFGYKSTFRLTGEFRSPEFETVGTFVGSTASNISAGASYMQELPYKINAGVSLSFTHQGSFDELSSGNGWRADFSLSKELWTNLNGALTVGYGRDQTTESATCAGCRQNGFEALARLAWSPNTQTRIMSSYDSTTQTAEVSGTYTSENQGAGSWATSATATVAPGSQDAISAAASYTGNRGTIAVTHSAGLAGIGFDGVSSVASTEERTSVSAASAFVFADGAWGIGRPVTGGFAVVTPHASLEGSPIVVGSANSPMAESGWFGPAVVPNLPAYRMTSLPYDAPDAPTGYDLGSANYGIHAPYKGGYALQAGSAYTVTAMGTLLDAHGEPLPLLAGTAREVDKPSGRKVELFTNRAGRFGAQGLAPGRWVIEMPTEPDPTRYAVDIPEGVKGLHNAGTLKPNQAGQLMAEAKQ